MKSSIPRSSLNVPMPKGATAPRGSYDDDGISNGAPLTVMVYESDKLPTGLLDQHGNPIMRQRAPLGFQKRSDR